jgi:hypothetical protein
MTNQIQASFSAEMTFTCEEVVTGNRLFSATVSNSATSYGTSHKKALRFAVKHVRKLNFLQGRKLVHEYFVKQAEPPTNLEKGKLRSNCIYECEPNYDQTYTACSSSSDEGVDYYYDTYTYQYTKTCIFDGKPQTSTCTCCPSSQSGTSAQDTCKEYANTCMTTSPANTCRCSIDYYADCECTQ